MNVTPTTSTTSAINSTDSISGPQQVLNQKDFLQLLVSQLQNQDPMNPQSDTDMAAQMAQFTSLQQSSSMSSSLAMIQADSLLGSSVTLQVDPQTTANGVVQGVVMQNGTPEILVNGASYTLSQVTSVSPAPSTSSSNPTSN